MEPVRCAGGCGKECLDPLAQGWEYLQITGRWRCLACRRELDEVNKPKDQDEETN